jgi:Tfp pilus assembly protein PilW
MSKAKRELFNNANSRGLTLIELLMALASTLTLLLILTGMLLSLQKNFSTQESLNIIQENARMVIEVLTAAIQNNKLRGTNNTITISDNTFLIESTARRDSSGIGIKALYAINKAGRKTELVEGVNAITFAYTVKSNKHLITLLADQVRDWSSVVGVSVQFKLYHFPFNKPWNAYIAV